MNTEILRIAAQFEDAYHGQPWFGKPIKELLKDADESRVFERPNNQHSILDLVWHMVTWREFTISRLAPFNKTIQYFEENDWRILDHSDKTLWPKALRQLEQTQKELLELLKRQEDSILENVVPERSYNYRNLLYGIVQHDIYHLGQIAYVNKLLVQK